MAKALKRGLYLFVSGYAAALGFIESAQFFRRGPVHAAAARFDLASHFCEFLLILLRPILGSTEYICDGLVHSLQQIPATLDPCLLRKIVREKIRW
jgi:hypothetical protein